jgi:hypothetical protein
MTFRETLSTMAAWLVNAVALVGASSAFSQALIATPDPLDFGVVAPNSTTSKSLTVNNLGGAAVTISAISVTS